MAIGVDRNGSDRVINLTQTTLDILCATSLEQISRSQSGLMALWGLTGCRPRVYFENSWMLRYPKPCR